MSASFSVVCYRSKTLKNGENPLMLQVSKNGKRQYKSLGVSIHPNVNMISEDAPMRFITEAEEMVGDSKESLHYPYGNIYRLRKPSSLETKTKSTIFDPTIIDNNGKMRIDWNNPNIFKAIGIPFVGSSI